jgi:hypothetical protein
MTADKHDRDLLWNRHLSGEMLSEEEAAQLLYELESDEAFRAECRLDRRILRALAPAPAPRKSVDEALADLERRFAEQAQAGQKKAPPSDDLLGDLVDLVSVATNFPTASAPALAAAGPERTRLGRVDFGEGVFADLVREPDGQGHLYLRAPHRQWQGQAYVLSVGEWAEEFVWLDAGRAGVSAELYISLELAAALVNAAPGEHRLTARPRDPA